MIRLRATVRCAEDLAERSPSQLYHELTSSGKSTRIPIPDWIVIEQATEGYLLIHVYLREGPFVHTWHPSIESAKEEAKQEFSIQEDEWEPVAGENSFQTEDLM